MSTAVLGIAAPSFFSAILIAWVFGYLLHDFTGLPMFGSLKDVDPFAGQVYRWQNLVLPAVTLGIRPLAIITQLTRASMLEVLGQDYIRTAWAKGLSPRRVVYGHALRNALNPVVTAVSGWFASLLAGAFFVEYIFAWQGIGKVTVEALETADLPVAMGSLLTLGSLFVLINIAVDIAYYLLDPRIRLR
jgi:peptide/nickel transport system permease protein